MRKIMITLVAVVVLASCGTDSDPKDYRSGNRKDCLNRGGIVKEDDRGYYDGCLYGNITGVIND